MFWGDHLNGDLPFRTQPSIHSAHAPDAYASIPHYLTQINLPWVSFLRSHHISKSTPIVLRLEHQHCLCSSDTGNGVAEMANLPVQNSQAVVSSSSWSPHCFDELHASHSHQGNHKGMSLGPQKMAHSWSCQSLQRAHCSLQIHHCHHCLCRHHCRQG